MKRLLLISALTLAGPYAMATAETPATDVQAASSQWESVFNSGNTRKLAALYTNDAVVVAPSLEIVSKREGIRDYWARQMQSGTGNFSIRSISIRTEGNRAYQTAVWVATVTSGGKANEFDGGMTNVLERQPDGSWKILLQSWN